MQIKRGDIGSRSSLKFINDLEKDMHTLESMILQNCARLTSEELEEQYLFIIDQFYADYAPTQYVRTYGMKNDIYKRYYKNRGNRYQGGIQLNSDWLDSRNYAIQDTGYLFDIVIQFGWHGSDSVFVSTPSPLESLIRTRDSIVRKMNSGNDVFNIQKRAIRMAFKSYKHALSKYK